MKNTIIKLVNKTNFFFIFTLMLVMVNYRSLIVDNFLGVYTDCLGCYKWWVISVDAKLLIIAFVVLFFSYTANNYFVRMFFRIFLLIFVVYFLVDVYLYKFLNQRLVVTDILTYFNIKTIVEIINRDLGFFALLSSVVSFTIAIMFLFVHNIIKGFFLEKTLLVLVIGLMLGFIIFTPKIDYINNVLIRNIYDINFNSNESVDYDDEIIKVLGDKIDKVEDLSCKISNNHQKKNIILLVWESLSMYQSNLFSGLNNWTPKLDQLAEGNRYYTNFFANNFTSLEGRLAILTGEKTFRNIAPLTMDRGRVGYWNTQRNIPRLLNSYDYSTSFLDGANLNFTRTGEYMQGIGFDYVEGEDYEGYNNNTRFGFNSVADNVLYDRVLDFISEETQPFFTTIISVTTHPPYINPETLKPSIKEATKFADKAVYNFYKSLEKSHYFDNGVLIIMSDHRSMTPVSKEEYQLFGKQAVARIPLVVIDKNFKGSPKSEEYLQQSDLLNSIDYLVSGNHCYRKGEGNIFSTPAIASECIFHNRGDYRDHIDVYCDNGKQSATVKLDGNNTRLIDGELENSSNVLKIINISRIAARKRHERHLIAVKKN